MTERWRLFTTNFILGETDALLLARLGRFVAARVLHELDHGATVMVRVRAADERRARELLTFNDIARRLCYHASEFVQGHRTPGAYPFTTEGTEDTEKDGFRFLAL